MESSSQPYVRLVGPRDAVSLADLFGQLGFPSSPEEVSARLDAAQDVALVAVVQERAVGVITFNVMPVLHRAHPVGRISALVVEQAARGRGPWSVAGRGH